MTSTFNNLEFENVAEALIKQHALNNVAKDDGSAYLARYDGMDDAGEYYDPEIWAYNGQDEILRMQLMMSWLAKCRLHSWLEKVASQGDSKG